MPLKTVIKTLDEAPKEFHDFYKPADENDDKSPFVLDLEGVDDHPAVKNLKSAHEKTKEARTKLATQLEELTAKIEKFPAEFDAEEFEALKQMKADLEASGGKDKDKQVAERLATQTQMHEQKMADVKKKHEAEVAKLKKTVEEKDSAIHRYLIDNGLNKALIEAGVGKEFLDAARALLRSSATVKEDEGEYVALIKTSDGDMIDLAKYVADWSTSDQGKPFVTQAKGGGSEGGSGRKEFDMQDNPWKEGPTFNLTRQGQIMRENRGKAERMAKAVGKTLPAA